MNGGKKNLNGLSLIHFSTLRDYTVKQYVLHYDTVALYKNVVSLSRGAPLLKLEDVSLSGQYLMSHGLTLPWSFPLTMWVIEGIKQ